MVGCLSVIVLLFLLGEADARKRRKRYISPVKVEQVATSPNPFIIGQSPLTLSMMVKVPATTQDSKILEVTALITSPTRRTMSFVTQRLPLAGTTQERKLGMVPVTLMWDGKDQYDQWVADGSYFYEIQAKVMEDKGEGPRTKIVSHRVQGTLEALAYVGEVLPPIPPEPEVPVEIEALELKELAEEELPLTEGAVPTEEASSSSAEDEGGDGSDLVLEGSSGGDSIDLSPNDTEEDLGLVVPTEVLLKEVEPLEPTTLESEVPASIADPHSESNSQSSLDPVASEPSSSLKEKPFQH